MPDSTDIALALGAGLVAAEATGVTDLTGGGGGGPQIIPIPSGGGDGGGGGIGAGVAQLIGETQGQLAGVRARSDMLATQLGQSSERVDDLRGVVEEQTSVLTRQADRLSESRSSVQTLRDSVESLRERLEASGPNVPTDTSDPTGGGTSGPGERQSPSPIPQSVVRATESPLQSVLREPQRAGQGVGNAAGGVVDTLTKSANTLSEATKLIATGEADASGTFAENEGPDRRNLRLPGINAPLFDGPIFGGGGSNRKGEPNSVDRDASNALSTLTGGLL